MTSIVTITPATNAVKCDANGFAEHVFTMTNERVKSIRVGARVLVDDSTKTSWLSIDGPAEWDLKARASGQVAVRFQAPSDAPPGRYTFRLLVYLSSDPGEYYTEGPRVSFEVTANPVAAPMPEPKAKGFPWWIAALVAGVLLTGGLMSYLLWPSTVTVPDLVGMSVARAGQVLKGADLAFESNELSGTVLSTDPPAGEKVDTNDADVVVQLVVAAAQRLPTEAPKPLDRITVAGKQFCARQFVYCAGNGDNAFFQGNSCFGLAVKGKSWILAEC